MSLQAGERKQCEACGVALIGGINPANGKVSPIEAAPDHDKGNVLLQRHTDGLVVAVTFGPSIAEGLRERHVELRMNHFATCPERERFERPTQTGAAS